jgi:hypothetical protein
VKAEAATQKLPNRYQDLKRFELPAESRGRGVLVVRLWGLVQATLFRNGTGPPSTMRPVLMQSAPIDGAGR